MTEQNTLIALFSYNRVRELEVCLRSVRGMCPGFDVVIIDDASELPGTHEVIRRNGGMFKDVFLRERPKRASRRNLPQNICEMYDYAIKHRYKYLFMMQDDTQLG